MRLKADDIEIKIPNIKNISKTEFNKDTIIGQSRVKEAMLSGLTIDKDGYNIFVIGPTGSGRRTIIQNLAKSISRKKKVPPDWVYANNFKDPTKPIAISFEPGMAKKFSNDLEEALKGIFKEFPNILNSNEIDESKKEINSEYKHKREKFFTEIQEYAKNLGFIVQSTPTGLSTVPAIGDRPMSVEELESLSEETKRNLQVQAEKITEFIEKKMKELVKIDYETKSKIKEIEKKYFLTKFGPYIYNLEDKYKNNEKAIKYISQIREDILKNIDHIKELFLKNNENRDSVDRIISRYKINVLVDNSEINGAPVVFERFPTYYNLFGRIEYVNKSGSYITDFSLIKSGSIHKANGGYLIIEADELLSEPLAYSGLKRLLKSKLIKIENISESYSLYPTLTLKPEQIPLNVKVILIGNQYIYNMLYYYDEEFRKLFKIRVEFDYEMNNNEENILSLYSFMDYISRRENIKKLSPSAKKEVIKYSIIKSETKKKITTKLSEIVNLMLESDSLSKGKTISKKDIIKALECRKRRGNLYEEKMMEMFKENKLLVDLQGSKVGQINGLVVVFSGEHEFGFPIKITARAFKGNAGVVDIEREVKLGGNVHSKAVMILTGFIGAKYKIDSPLSFTATISHEQVYGPIDGDSATLAETIVLLSSLANIPIKQNFAITGSMDQFGNAQPVGGVKYKVEGFYNACRSKGITDNIGVVLPESNIDDLVLEDYLVEAVRNEKFHIYSVKNIDEAIEIMTGLKAGSMNSRGKYPRGTFHYRVQKALEQLSKEEETKKRNRKRR